VDKLPGESTQAGRLRYDQGAVGKVLIVGPVPPPYHGVATFIRDLLEAAPRQTRFHFEHLDTSDRRDASNLGRWDAQNLSLGFANLAELASRLLRGRHDLVYVPISQNVPAFLRDALFVILSRLHGSRVVLHLHGGYFREFFDREAPAWFRTVARRVLKRARAVIVLAEEFRPIFEGLVAPNRIHVVENGVPDLFAEVTHAHIVPKPRTILYMSTLARTKGILDLVRALIFLRSDIPDVRLRVAGNWSEEHTRAETLDVIARGNLNDTVEFVGNVDGAAKRAFLMSGDLFCLPTHYPYEGQPLVVLEAMSAGLPVLSTRHGALASTVQDGVTGRLLERGCGPRELAEALREMLSDAACLRAQGVVARARYLERYMLEQCHTRLLDVFEQALKL